MVVRRRSNAEGPSRLGPSGVRLALIVSAVSLAPALTTAQPVPDRPPGAVRVATFNVALNRSAAGELVAELAAPDSAQARAVAEIIQLVAPDILLLNEIDHDPGGEALALFQRNYLEVGQNGAPSIAYGYAFTAPVNTGVPSGFDLDGDGHVGGPGDALGYGAFPGQYGMALLSRHPILPGTRTFRTFLWRDLPGNLIPEGWYSDGALAVLPLSSKSHWDVPVRIGDAVLHLLASHPTPPVFDGPEDRNGRRNHDEIRFWIDYLEGGAAGHLVDDDGAAGGLPADAAFVVLGDLNADPADGDGRREVIIRLLGHPRVQDPEPRSAGGVAAAERQGGANTRHAGDPALDTADFRDVPGPGNLRVDYVLPSADLAVVGAGVFWPTPDDPLHRLIGEDGRAASDHRLVWVDLRLD